MQQSIPPPTAGELARECHCLIYRLERHPLSTKLLLSARRGLLVLAGYKAGRAAAALKRGRSP